MQDGSQRVSTARPRGEKPGSDWDRHGGVGGHLLVHTELLQRREALTQHCHCRTQGTSLLCNEVCNMKKSISVRVTLGLIILGSVRCQCYLCADSEQKGRSDRLVLTQMMSLRVSAAFQLSAVLMRPGHAVHHGLTSPAAQNVGLLTVFCPLRKK